MSIPFKLSENETTCKSCGRLILKSDGTFCQKCKTKGALTPFQKEAQDFRERITSILESENVVHESEWAMLCGDMLTILNKIVEGKT